MVRIGPRRLGPGHPCYVIAEIGVNHNGNMDAAIALIRAARRAGADCAKFQTFSATRLVSRGAMKAPYQRRTTPADESQLEMLTRLELSRDAHQTLMRCCAEEGIEFLSTPYDEDDAELLASLGVTAFKIPSALIAEPVFLASVAAHRKPMIVSTGMATLAEVADAVDAIRSEGNEELVLLQCTTEYPTSIDDANVRAMHTLASTFGVPAGFSDHTTSSTAALVAVALGACVIEKHFTLDKSQPGPDHAASADPPEFAALVCSIREAERALGSADKTPTAAERQNIVAMRRGVVARRAIHAGERIDETMLTTKRPATGVPARDLGRVIGALAAADIDADTPIDWSMLDRTGHH